MDDLRVYAETTLRTCSFPRNCFSCLVKLDKRKKKNDDDEEEEEVEEATSKIRNRKHIKGNGLEIIIE